MPEEGAKLASPPRRIAGYALDAWIGGVFFAPFLIGMQITGDFNDHSFDLVAFYAWGIPAWVSYLALIVHLEGEKGFTPAKWALAMRVVDAGAGGIIGWRRDLARRLMFFVEAIPLYLGWLWMFWDKRHQAWHDKVARSLVIRGPAARYSLGSVVLALVAVTGAAGVAAAAITADSVSAIVNGCVCLGAALALFVKEHRAGRTR